MGPDVVGRRDVHGEPVAEGLPPGRSWLGCVMSVTVCAMVVLETDPTGVEHGEVASSETDGADGDGYREISTVVVHRPGAASVVTLSTIATGFTSDGVPAANMVTTRIVAAWASARRVGGGGAGAD